MRAFMYLPVLTYMRVNIWFLMVILDDMFLSFKEFSLYYMVIHLEYYVTRNQTLEAGLHLPVGPWNHYVHLSL